MSQYDPDHKMTPKQKQWLAVFDTLTNPVANLTDLQDITLPMLVERWKKLVLDPSDPNPPKTHSAFWAKRLTNDNARENLMDALFQCLSKLDIRIGDMLAGGKESNEVLLSESFKDIRTIDSGISYLETATQSMPYAVGLTNSLPIGSPLRDLLPLEKQYLHAGLSPAYVLGPVNFNGDPRRWYLTDSVKQLTASFRSTQDTKKREADDLKHLEELNEQRRLQASKEYQFYLNMKEAERMKQAGYFDKLDKAPAEPTIRIGR